MQKHPDRTFVHQQHLEKGIEKYKGAIDAPLLELLTRSDWKYTPYRFADQRILLVYEDRLFGILYKNETALHAHLEETSE
ncbi:MAG: hypothetical protein KDC34_15395 [Saprospiraceae bacterium]|nr:hypothetical protein [Saprospiraceae bacterium]